MASITEQVQMEFVEKYAKAKKRLLTVEYDGVLMPSQIEPGLTIPDRDIKNFVNRLASDTRNTVMLVSGRDREHLDLHWSRRNLVLVAEHGASHRNHGDPWRSFFEPSNEWIDQIEHYLTHLVFQFKGSFVVRRRYSITWHYGSILDRISGAQIREIVASLRALPKSDYFKIYQPYRGIELRSQGLTHPAFISAWTDQQEFDFVLTVGVDESSSPIFELSNSGIPVILATGSMKRLTTTLESQSKVIPWLRVLAGANATKKSSMWPF